MEETAKICATDCTIVKRPVELTPEDIRLEERYVDIRTDTVFKMIFGKAQNKDLLISLLNEIIEDFKISDIDYRDKEQISGSDEKRSVYDIFCSTDDGKNIVVEMQFEPTSDLMNRMLCYSTYPIMEQLQKGDKSYHINLVYVITFCNFAIEHEEDWEQNSDGIISRYSIREESNGELMTGALKFIFVELGRFTIGCEDARSLRDKWLYSLKHMHELRQKPDNFKDNIMEKLYNVTELYSLPREERVKYILERKRILDTNSLIYDHEEKGRTEGRKESAKNMVRENIPADVISRCTGLSIEEISRLQ